MIRNFLILASTLFVSFSLFSCGLKNSNKFSMMVNEERKQVGNSVFSTSKSGSDVNVIFFDGDNLISNDGLSFTRSKRQVSNTLGSSDSYMVKSGTCEMLVDCGYQSVTSYGSVSKNYNYINQYVKNNFEDNLLKKIATVLSDDGVLDYLIVTHADFDHIASLIVDGGLFDCFLNNRTIIDLNGKEKKFTQIKYLIDFDSGLVKKFSNEDLDKEKRLVRSDEYQSYVYKKRLLVENGTSYCPASAFFNTEVVKRFEHEMDKDNKNISMPDAIIKRLENVPDNPSTNYVLDEYYDNNVEIKLDSEYLNEPILSMDNGSLKYCDVSGSKRFYYSLKFNTSELRILYNWHYDYIFHSSFNENVGGDESTQIQDPQRNVYDSQDANNISVCFQIHNDKFKFLSLGDLGGNGENGLLKYYDGTEILSNVSVFKASHHGSVYNGENSKNLFIKINPDVVIITGCAMYKNALWKNQSDDPIMSAMVGRTKVKQEFFDNLSERNNKKTYILCTNIACLSDSKFESLPFYGDIKIRYSGGQMHLSYSYIGEIQAYISQQWNSNYFRNNKKEFCFTTRKDNKFVKLQDTDWFKNIGYSFGG